MLTVDPVIAASSAEARPYQRRITQKAVDMFAGLYKNKAGAVERAVDSVNVNSPTGSGKTVMAHITAATLQRNCQALGASKLDVVWFAMRRNLLKQAANELSGKGFGTEVQFYSMFESKLPEALLKDNRADDHKVLLVLDESQHQATDTMMSQITAISPEYMLGLSATPYRCDNLKLVFSKQINDCGIHQLIRDGYLSEYAHYTIPSWNPVALADFYGREPSRWGRSVVYFHKHESCLAFQHRLVTEYGINSEVVTASTDRYDQIERFEAGEYPVLVNMMVLTEGFDCPSLQTAFVRPSGKGPTIQMAGRVFRRFEGLPVKQVVQCMKRKRGGAPGQEGQKLHSMLETATPIQSYGWQDDEWRSLKLNPRIDEITRNNRIMMAMMDVPMPCWLQERKLGKGKSVISLDSLSNNSASKKKKR